MNDRKKIMKEVIGRLYLTYTLGRPNEDEMIHVVRSWDRALRRFEPEAIVKGCDAMVERREERGWPVPQELVRYIVRYGRVGSRAQWATAVRIAEEWTDYGPQMTHPDPVSHQIIKTMGGIEAIASANWEKLQWLEKRFLEQMKEYEGDPDQMALLLELPSFPVQGLLEGVIKGLPAPKERATAPEPSPSRKEKPEMRKYRQNTPEELRRQAKKLLDLEEVKKIAEEEE